MARSTDLIKKEITDEFIGYPEIQTKYGLDTQKTFEEQFSKVSLESIFFYVCSYAIRALEVLFDTHKSEVNQVVDNERYGKLGWYEKMALLYQHGRPLVEEYDYYDNSDSSNEQIEARQVIKFCAAKEIAEGMIVLRTAKGVPGAIEKNEPEEVSGAQSYINKIKPAGVRVLVSSSDADMLKVSLNIQFDPLILDATGHRLDNPTSTPVLDAITNYLNSIKFFGDYSNMRLVDAVQDVEGVIIIDLLAAWGKYSGQNYTPITSRYPTESGFMSLDTDSIPLIHYEPYV